MIKRWRLLISLIVVISICTGCGMAALLFEEETDGYGRRDAETITEYFQGMERLLTEEQLEMITAKRQELSERDHSEQGETAQKAWIAFEEELRAESIPMGYADLETFLETERKGLGEAAYAEAMELVAKWVEIPADSEENGPVEDAMDEILADLGITFADLAGMINDREAMLGLYCVEDAQLIAQDPKWLSPMEKSERQESNVRAIWDRVETMIPQALLLRVTEFAAVTDGEENIMAYVYPLSEDLKTWRLTVDYLDFVDESGMLELKCGDETLLHEFGHILSLNETQMDLEAVETLQVDEGRLAKLSYLNRFYQRFWKTLDSEWQEAVSAEAGEDALFDFYLAHEASFLNDYAATNPAEDFAETFAQFVLREQPGSSANGVEEKIIFFYQFPELVKMRQEMRQGLKLLEEAA